jgi:hypothetical protein
MFIDNHIASKELDLWLNTAGSIFGKEEGLLLNSSMNIEQKSVLSKGNFVGFDLNHHSKIDEYSIDSLRVKDADRRDSIIEKVRLAAFEIKKLTDFNSA